MPPVQSRVFLRWKHVCKIGVSTWLVSAAFVIFETNTPDLVGERDCDDANDTSQNNSIGETIAT